MKKHLRIAKHLTLPVMTGMFVFTLALIASPDVYAQLDAGITAAGKGDGLSQGTTPDAIVTSIVNIFLYIVGAIAVIMIIFSGFQYLTSAGDATKAKKAQSTLLYSIVGLVVAVFALAITNFVLDSVT